MQTAFMVLLGCNKLAMTGALPGVARRPGTESYRSER